MQTLDEIIERGVTSGGEAGASVVINKNGRQVYSYSAGFADVEEKKVFGADTICRAFSCSKVVTATAAMILMQRGKLDTSWELGWLFPEFDKPFYIREGKKLESPKIRIRDLLNMTSGIPYPGGGNEGIQGTNELWGAMDASIRNGDPMTTEEFARQAGAQALMFPCGQEWMYGASADVLGAVIEKLADMRFSQFLEENIFKPLGMNDTAFFVPKEKRDRLAVLYEGTGETRKKCEWVNLCIYDYEQAPAFESGGAGLFTTANDFSKLGAELSHGGAGVISRAAVNFMSKNGLTPEQRRTFNWDSTRGYGYANLCRTLEDVNLAGTFAPEGSFGWDGWTGTYLLNDPKNGISTTVFLQRAGAGTTQLARDVVNGFYAQG